MKKTSLVSILFLALLSACDDDKQADLVAKTAPDAAKPVPSVTAAAVYDAGPPSRPKIVCGPGPAVDFHGNAPLETEVMRKLGRDGGTVTQNDLKSIKSINLSQATVNDLDPCVFPLFTGMKDLFLGPGDLDNLAPLATLTQLITLRASINKVRDITPLTKMTQMDRLDLGRTSVQDVGPLANMTALTELQLDDTMVTDLTPLASCKNLERLSIRNTPVVDISALKNLKKLKYLYIEGSPVADTSVVQGISGLKIVRKGRM
jgi:internalin A